MRITYKILICDDNNHYIKRLQEALSEINLNTNNFYFETYIATTPSECLSKIQENTFDIILLDVCIKSSNEKNKTTSDLIRDSINAEYYGPELYNQILKVNPDIKIFVVSNLNIKTLRTLFNGAPLEYFNKHHSSVQQIVQCIKNYFDTGKERIYNNAFIVYGHNKVMRTSVENFIKSRGLNSIDLFNNSTGGIQSVFDALNSCTNTAECAIILLSADDIILTKDNLEFFYRARQNVIFEMGLFAGHLGRDKVIVLYEKHSKFEFPSDINGVFYIEYDEYENWKELLSNSLQKIGFNI